MLLSVLAAAGSIGRSRLPQAAFRESGCSACRQAEFYPLLGQNAPGDRAISRSVSTDSDGQRTVSYSESEQVVNRFTINDVSLTSDHPFWSSLRISRGAAAPGVFEVAHFDRE